MLRFPVQIKFLFLYWIESDYIISFYNFSEKVISRKELRLIYKVLREEISSSHF